MAAVSQPAGAPVAHSGTGASTLAAMLLEAADRGAGTALVYAGGADPVSYPQLGAAAREIAAGLIALGVEAGDRVALLGETRPEWTLADAGALVAGAAVAPIYQTNSPEECAYVLAHSEARVVLCEDAAQAGKVEAVRERCPALEHVVVMTGAAAGAMTLEELRALGRDGDPDAVAARAAAVRPQDVATIVYTSGTTGPPKGCVVTHAAVMATIDMYRRRLQLDGDEPPVIFIFLPLAHLLARVTELLTLDVGGTLVFWNRDMRRLAEDLAAARPTHVPAVPRVYEKVHQQVLDRLAAGERLQRELFRWALREGRAARARERAGRRGTAVERARHALADRLVLRRVRDVFGGRLRLALTGAAPIGRPTLDFFDACGVLVLEGYGMTESCAAATLGHPDAPRLGTVGPPLDGTGVRIADDGEVLLSGPNLFAGYHRDPEATAETLSGGWLHTGDLGTLEDGHLRITGRKKDLIITSSGKNVSPANLENALRESRWISEAVVYGDGRSYLVALLTLDPDETGALAECAGVPPGPELAADERVHAVIAADVEAVNARFARIEQIKRFAILEHVFTQEAGELTPTMKIKRGLVYQRYADRFAALYED